MIANSCAPLDVLVIGGGNAALCAAITARRARRARARARMRDRKIFAAATAATRATSATCTERPTEFVTGAYPEEEFWQDLLRVTGGATNERSRV